MNKILILAAHPDDEVLGCGALIKRLVQEGKEVHVFILGEGISSRYRNGNDQSQKLLRDLHDTSRRVANFLGVKSCRIGNLSDNKFDIVAMLDIVRMIENVINELKPDTVFTQNSSDLNIDHSIVFRATLIATRPMTGKSVMRLFSYEVNSSTEWSFGQLGRTFNPNYFMDVTNFIDSKIEAMGMYLSEIREFPHPRSDKAILVQAQKWGSVCGCFAAEAFQTIFLIQK